MTEELSAERKSFRKEYIAFLIAFGIIGFCEEELKPFGPVQEKVAPGSLFANNERVVPEQTGLLLDVDKFGSGLMLTEVEPAAPVQPFTVAVTE